MREVIIREIKNEPTLIDKVIHCKQFKPCWLKFHPCKYNQPTNVSQSIEGLKSNSSVQF